MTALTANPLHLLMAMGALAVLPYFLLGLTSYAKLSIVFGLLRVALGAQQVPSGAITSLLAFVLTGYVMQPVFRQSLEEAAPVIRSASGRETTAETLALASRAWRAAESPLLKFLAKHSAPRERLFFRAEGMDAAQHSAQRPREGQCQAPPSASSNVSLPHPPTESTDEVCLMDGEGLPSLAAAFLITELKQGFAIGFLLFLPFLVVDLVVANVLVALGMTMVSPAAIALPLKLFLFVETDSWFLITKSLLGSYR